MKYMPGIYALVHVLQKGKNEEIGILTARGNKQAHLVLLEDLKKFIKKEFGYDLKIKNENIYFCGDIESVKNKPELYEAWKRTRKGSYRKALVLKYYATHGYDVVKFYDDTDKNLYVAREVAKTLSSEDGIIKVYDIKEFDENKLLAPKGKDKGRVIHFFDLDSTIWQMRKEYYTYYWIMGEEDFVLETAKIVFDLEEEKCFEIYDVVDLKTSYKFIFEGENVDKALSPCLKQLIRRIRDKFDFDIVFNSKMSNKKNRIIIDSSSFVDKNAIYRQRSNFPEAFYTEEILKIIS